MKRSAPEPALTTVIVPAAACRSTVTPPELAEASKLVTVVATEFILRLPVPFTTIVVTSSPPRVRTLAPVAATVTVSISVSVATTDTSATVGDVEARVPTPEAFNVIASVMPASAMNVESIADVNALC